MIRLNHPNIIRVFHFGVHDDMPWQTMELVTGTPVQAYIMRKGRPGDARRIEEVIRLGHDIAQALHHVHRKGLVHRDLKSANLLVLPDGRIKLIDFGSSTLFECVPTAPTAKQSAEPIAKASGPFRSCCVLRSIISQPKSSTAIGTIVSIPMNENMACVRIDAPPKLI